MLVSSTTRNDTVNGSCPTMLGEPKTLVYSLCLSKTPHKNSRRFNYLVEVSSEAMYSSESVRLAFLETLCRIAA